MNLALNMMINDKTKTITIEHLAAYLPYGVIVVSNQGTKFRLSVNGNMKGNGIENRSMSIVLDNNYKPLLRQLSQLTETIEHNGERFVPIDRLSCMYEFELSNLYHIRMYINQSWTTRMTDLPYDMFNQLMQWHFDTFGLIEPGLAIPIPSIPQP